MTMRNCFEYFFTQVFAKFHYPFLMTGWTEMTTLTRKCQEVFMSTVLTSYSCKSVMQDTAIKITIDNLSHIRPEKAILSFKALFIDLFKCFKTCPVK